MNTTNTPRFTTSDLAMFTGSEEFFRDRLTKSIYTQGCQFLATHGCAWMISDILIICKTHKKVCKEAFVSIKFKRQSDGKCVISYEDGDYGKLFSQTYDSSDCPVDEVKFFFANNTLMLASEY